MTEREMIEEMAQVLETAKIKALATIGSLNNGFGEWYATALYEAGYRRVDKGAVVLTKEEYSDYLVLKNDYEHASEKLKELQGDNERLYRNLGKLKYSVRKETAREILEDWAISDCETGGYNLPYIDALKKIYGVEVEE